MAHTKVMFSVNTFDYEGDLIEEGVYLHFGPCTVKVGDNIKDYESFVSQLSDMTNEIRDNYNP